MHLVDVGGGEDAVAISHLSSNWNMPKSAKS